MSTGISGRPRAKIITQAAVLRPTPGQLDQEVDRLVALGLGEPVERRLVVGERQLAQHLLDPRRLRRRQAARAGSPPRPPRPARRGPRPRSETPRAGARRRRRDCGRWCSGTGSCAPARRSGGRAGCSRGGRRARAAGRGSPARAPARTPPAVGGRLGRPAAVTGARIFSARWLRSSRRSSHVDGVRTFYPPGRRRGPAGGLRARPPDPLRGLAAVPGAARRAGARPRPPGLGLLRAPARASTTRCTASRGSSGASSTRSRSTSARSSSTTGASVGADRRPAPPGASAPARASSTPCPLLPGYRWHWIARYMWRVPVVGELVQPDRDQAGAAAALAPGVAAAGADAGRVHRAGAARPPAGHLAGVARAVSLGRPRPARRRRGAARAARVPGAGRLGRARSLPAAGFARAYAERLPRRGAASSSTTRATGRGWTARS